MSENAAVIREFCAAWARLDADELADYFTEDGIYHNIPAQPVAGRDAVRQFIAGFSADWTATDWEILTLVAQGDVVIAERVDRTKTTKGDVDLPCVGIFEMRGGKIARWRDYFDLGTYLRAVGAA